MRSSLSALKQQVRLHVWHELDARGISTARVIEVNPDAPQRPVRFRALREGKTLLMPTPRLRAGFVLIDHPLLRRTGGGRRPASKAPSSSGS